MAKQQKTIRPNGRTRGFVVSGVDMHSRTQVRRALWGLLFVLPWAIGACWLFLIPMGQSVVYAFSKVTLTPTGDDLRYIGIANFRYLFTEDPYFITNLASSLRTMLYQVAVIVVFSLFIAVLLREEFFGRTLVRSIFFFPVIITSGVVITILREQALMTAESLTGQQEAVMFAAPSFDYFVENLGVPEAAAELVRNVSSGFFDIVWKSGVQITLLLTAVNHISSSSYEAADIEGASWWEKLWKITFPMISPTVLVVLIYSIIDSFTDYGNKVMRMITDFFERGLYEYSATVGIVYFAVILLLVGAVNLIIGRRIQYVTR